MRKIDKYDINIPQLGDRPDITVVSDAIDRVADATASAIEFMECSVQAKEMRLTSLNRKFKRTEYYDGMMVSFVSPRRIKPTEVSSLTIDDLAKQPLVIDFTVNSGEVAMCAYLGGKFTVVSSGMNKQDVKDEGLDTKDKTIVGAINELRTSLMSVATEEEMIDLLHRHGEV